MLGKLCYGVRQPSQSAVLLDSPVQNPNALAYLMIAIWPLVAYQLWTRLDPARALIWTILAGYLILPPLTSFNLPVVPDLDKTSIPNLVCLALALFLLRDRIDFLPESPVGKLLIGLYILSPFLTVLTNAEEIPIIAQPVPGLRIYDSVAAVINQAILLLPFFLARRYLAEAKAFRVFLMALIAAGLWYSIPIVIESRLSPQINVWVYGFFQHDFSQTIRFGGYRPVVFLPHGLWLAFFVLMCFMASASILREGPAEQRPRQFAVMVYLGAMLVVCKSAGPMVYAVAFVPLVLVAGRRVQIWVAAAASVVVISYPLLRGLHLIPLDQILQTAMGISPEKAASLGFRINNEELLIQRASLKPWFGWGGYGRSLILDPITGQIETIADGAWIITLGIYGWCGYIAEFGLMSLPLWLLARESCFQKPAVFAQSVATVALIYAANMADLLPNGTTVPLTWLMAGALLGHAEALQRQRAAAKASAEQLARTMPRRTVI